MKHLDILRQIAAQAPQQLNERPIMPASWSKYVKLATTVIGAVLIVLNEALPLFTGSAQHWVTGAIAVLTIVARDIAEITGGTSNVSAKAPKQAP